MTGKKWIAWTVAITASLVGGDLVNNDVAADPRDPQDRHQAFLQWEEGTWDADITVLDPQSGQSMSFRGEQRDVIGGCGKWLITDLEMVKGPSGEEPPPYHGHGVVGWDPVKEKLVGVWVDSNMSMLGVAEGTINDEGTRLEMEVEGRNPATGTPMPRRFVTTRVDENTRKMETLLRMPDGSMVIVATIEYKRRG